MSNDENYIKMDGEPDAFEGGAIRYSKKGKGRFDLIPKDSVYFILGFAELMFKEKPTAIFTKADILKDAFINDRQRYIKAIIDFVAIEYGYHIEKDEDYNVVAITYNDWLIGFVRALRDLAVHYEYGAEKYGVDNWKNGIPITGGDRGGSFTDSGIRHLTQWYLGETDEKHGVAFMWNFMNAAYLQLQQTSPKVEAILEERYQNNKKIMGEDVYDFEDDITD